MPPSDELPTRLSPRADASDALRQSSFTPDIGGALVGERYRIERLIGQGGLANVYLAEDVRLSRRVAVKISGEATAGAVERFRREIQMSRQLQHPNIVALLDYGEAAPGVPFQVFELVDGDSLQQLLDRKHTLSWQRTVEIAASIADALSVAHEVGVLHRDLAPKNVLLDVSHGEPAIPRLTDFGALGELMDADRHGQRLTMAGVVIGTPSYMAPEQLLGERHSPATDIFGLGMLMLEMIFRTASQTGTLHSFMAKRMTEETDIPWNPPIPSALRELLAGMLRRDPGERPQSAAEVRDELREIQQSRELESTLAFPVVVAAARRSLDTLRPGRLMHGFAAGRAPSAKAAMMPALPLVLAGVMGAFIITLVWSVFSGRLALLLRGPLGAALPGIALGLLLIAVGSLAGAALTRVLMRRQSTLRGDAGKLLLGTKDRRALTQTLVIELEVLVDRVKEIDARILGITVVQMIREYETAKASPDRQAALMNATKLLKQFMEHLSPWYVRHAKAVGFGVSVIGAASGLVKVVEGVVKIAR